MKIAEISQTVEDLALELRALKIRVAELEGAKCAKPCAAVKAAKPAVKPAVKPVKPGRR